MVLPFCLFQSQILSMLSCSIRGLVGVRAPRCCTRDGGRPLGVGLQEQTSNRLKLHGLRALVVSVEGKDMAETMSGEVQGDERKRTTDEVSKTKRRCRNWRRTLLQDKSRGNLFTAWTASGIKVA